FHRPDAGASDLNTPLAPALGWHNELSPKPAFLRTRLRTLEVAMKRLLLGAVTTSLLIAAIALSSAQKQVSGELDVQSEKRNPWTNLKLNNSPDTFHFAVVSDRTGGHRARVF